jgi:hypothetical protein
MSSRADNAKLSADEERFLRELGQQLRGDSIRCSTAAGSGHPTSAMSAADLMAVLLARHLRYDWDNPGEPGNDHLIFSKGHASPVLYAMFKAAGAITDKELVTGFRRFGSRLQGHPTPALHGSTVRYPCDATSAAALVAEAAATPGIVYPRTTRASDATALVPVPGGMPGPYRVPVTASRRVMLHAGQSARADPLRISPSLRVPPRRLPGAVKLPA